MQRRVAASHIRKSVLLLDADKIRASLLARELESLGYLLVANLRSSDYLLKEIELTAPDIVVVGLDLSDNSVVEKVASLQMLQPHPVIMFAEQDTPQIIQNVIKAGVSAFVVDDIQPERLNSIINIAVARFDEEQRLRRELAKTKHQLEERKLIDKAKGLLMSMRGISEVDAYKLLRKMAMDKGLTLAVVAANVIDVLALVSE